MISFEEFFKHPGWNEICRQIRLEISQAQRPASEIILDDVDFCEMMKICKRTSAAMRATREITYHKIGGKVYYKLSDILDYINANKVEANTNYIKSRFK